MQNFAGDQASHPAFTGCAKSGASTANNRLKWWSQWWLNGSWGIPIWPVTQGIEIRAATKSARQMPEVNGKNTALHEEQGPLKKLLVEENVNGFERKCAGCISWFLSFERRVAGKRTTSPTFIYPPCPSTRQTRDTQHIFAMLVYTYTYNIHVWQKNQTWEYSSAVCVPCSISCIPKFLLLAVWIPQRPSSRPPSGSPYSPRWSRWPWSTSPEMTQVSKGELCVVQKTHIPTYICTYIYIYIYIALSLYHIHIKYVYRYIEIILDDILSGALKELLDKLISPWLGLPIFCRNHFSWLTSGFLQSTANLQPMWIYIYSYILEISIDR